MNGKHIVKKNFPYCPDCGYIMLPRPAEERDGCIVRPFRCLICDEEKDVWVIRILTQKPDDAEGFTRHRSVCERSRRGGVVMNCTLCGKELHNGLDTFGDVGSEICQDCWIHLPETFPTRDWYGLAPHIHDLTITGDIIGSTVFTDLSQYPKNEYGEYEIEPGLTFWPDPETGGTMGVWTEAGAS